MKTKCLLPLGVLLVGVTAATSLFGAQKPTPPQPTEQQKLKERMDTLESQLKEAQAKADRAVMEKEYIERIQKEAKDYYDKAFLTQLAIVTIIGLFVAAAGKFGVDHIVQSKLTEASAQLREGFRKEIADELQKLQDSNATQMKDLETGLTRQIEQIDTDLKTRSEFQFQFSQGLSLLGYKRYDECRKHFRSALRIYKPARKVIRTTGAVRCIENILRSFRIEDATNFADNGKKELARKLYDGLEIELAQAALHVSWAAPLINERIDAPPTDASASATTPAPDKAQTTKPPGAVREEET